MAAILDLTIHAVAIIAITAHAPFEPLVKHRYLLTFPMPANHLNRLVPRYDEGWMAHPRKDSATRKSRRLDKTFLIALDQYLPYLINRVGNTLVQLFSRDLAQFNISVPMWRVIAILGAMGRLRLIDLSSMTSIDASTLSRLTETMQRRKLLERGRSRENKREITISLTRRGQDLLEIVTPIAAAYEREMTIGISGPDLKTTRETLRQMFARLEELKVKAREEMNRSRRQMPVLAKRIVSTFEEI